MPEAFVKFNVGNVPYPEALTLLEETFVAISFAVSREVASVRRVPEALVKANVGKRP